MFKWDNAYSVKIPLIDEQHKKLFLISEKIHSLFLDFKNDNSKDKQVLLESLFELIQYTNYHFTQEEKLMHSYNYPDIDEHIKEHKSFIKYLNNMDYYNNVENFEEVLENLIAFLSKWIFSHIMNTDFKYSDFLKNSMNI